MEPAFLCTGDLFGHGDDGTSDSCTQVEQADAGSVERQHTFPGMVLQVREFMFHQVNANLLWPGSSVFAQWLTDHKELVHGRRILELGSGTGALAIFLKKALAADITTCDYDDQEIESNIAHNCRINEVPQLPHIRHTWGEHFPVDKPTWDLVLASDILLYVKQYANLIRTLEFLLLQYMPASNRTLPSGNDTVIRSETENSERRLVQSDSSVLPVPCFLMSWRRRIPKEDEMLFFAGCTDAGLQVKDFGSRVYCISASGYRVR